VKYRKLSLPGADGPLDPGGDYTFGQGVAGFHVNTADGVAQAVATRLRLYTGDYFLDQLEGTAWRGRVLGKNTRSTHDLELRTRILGSAGVAGLPVYRSVLDGETRRLAVQAAIDTIYGRTAVAVPAVRVQAPIVPADQVPVPLLGADGDFLFGPGGEDLVANLAEPRVHFGEAGRIPYGALLDDSGYLTDGSGEALIAALGVMPRQPPLPAFALVDGFGESLALILLPLLRRSAVRCR
jgi:hypothetical protein